MLRRISDGSIRRTMKPSPSFVKERVDKDEKSSDVKLVSLFQLVIQFKEDILLWFLCVDVISVSCLCVCLIEQFRFATRKQKVFYVLGCFSAMLSALMIPIDVILYGEFASLMVDRISQIGTVTPTILMPLFGGGQPV